MLTAEQIVANFQLRMKVVPDSQGKVVDYLDFIITYSDTLGPEMRLLIDECKAICEKINFRAGYVLCECNLFFILDMTRGASQDPEGKSHPANMQKMVEDISYDKEMYLLGMNLVSYAYWFRHEYDKGFQVILDTYKRSVESNTSSVNLAWLNYALGVFYFDTRDLEKSYDNYEKARELFSRVQYKYGMGRAANGMATVLISRGKTNEALPLIEYAADIFRELSHASGLSRALNDMGLIEKANKNYGRAIEILNESINIRKMLNHVQGLITSMTELGEIYLETGKIELAYENLLGALEYSKQAKATQKEMRLYKLLSDAYKREGDLAKALAFFELFYELRSKVLGDEAATKLKKVQTDFEKEKSEREAEIERLKNVELKKAYELIEQKNKDIHDSINYAKRIQRSILPSDEDLKKCFKDYFVLFKPKDIVSGDFYWAVNATSSKSGINVSLMAAIDCTGHGVPGGFMSMLGNTLLNQTISNPEIIYPSDVLNYLSRELPQNLKSVENETTIRDGMDMGLCSFDWKNKVMYFSGANNPCWIIRNKQLIELAPDKQAISANTESHHKSFTDKKFDFQPNDLVYLFTDGYADQFGGPKGKKFKYKTLQKLLVDISDKEMSAQQKILDHEFEKWRGELEQIDDVLITGIRV